MCVSHVCLSFNEVSDRLCAAGLDAGVTRFRLNTDGEGTIRPIQPDGASCRCTEQPCNLNTR